MCHCMKAPFFRLNSAKFWFCKGSKIELCIGSWCVALSLCERQEPGACSATAGWQSSDGHLLSLGFTSLVGKSLNGTSKRLWNPGIP